jgi:hypothetical protein
VISWLLLDTHVALWLDSGLRTSTRFHIDRCWQNGDTIFLSAVATWKIVLLVGTGRIDLEFALRRGSGIAASTECRCPTDPPATAIGCIISSTATQRTGF